jgi:hypothetical protein
MGYRRPDHTGATWALRIVFQRGYWDNQLPEVERAISPRHWKSSATARCWRSNRGVRIAPGRAGQSVPPKNRPRAATRPGASRASTSRGRSHAMRPLAVALRDCTTADCQHRRREHQRGGKPNYSNSAHSSRAALWRREIRGAEKTTLHHRRQFCVLGGRDNLCRVDTPSHLATRKTGGEYFGEPKTTFILISR